MEPQSSNDEGSHAAADLESSARLVIMPTVVSQLDPGAAMLTVHVHILVKPDRVDAFKAACIENSRNSLQEPGIARFDVLQQQDDPTRFVLVEIYRSAEAPAAHKQTAHYQKWAEAVADMMAVPRFSVKFDNVGPEAGLP
jgi:(4S)-4-hydroxy-5-phosphonooxypentane-2,3-dione isomerase